MILHPDAHRLMPYARRETMRCDGIPQGHGLLETHPLDFRQGTGIWAGWRVDHDAPRPGWRGRLRDWWHGQRPVPEFHYQHSEERDPRYPHDRSNYPAMGEFAEELLGLRVSCQMAIVRAPWSPLPPWLHLVSFCRGPEWARLFYVSLARFNWLEPGYDPTTPLGEAERPIHHAPDEILSTTGTRLKRYKELWEQRPRCFRTGRHYVLEPVE